MTLSKAISPAGVISSTWAVMGCSSVALSRTTTPVFSSGEVTRRLAGIATISRNSAPPRPERPTLGVAFVFNNYLAVSAPAPYLVNDASHPFFAGTGLADGDPIGSSGRNGAASGWEIDVSDAGSSTGRNDRDRLGKR